MINDIDVKELQQALETLTGPNLIAEEALSEGDHDHDHNHYEF